MATRQPPYPITFRIYNSRACFINKRNLSLTHRLVLTILKINDTFLMGLTQKVQQLAIVDFLLNPEMSECKEFQPKLFKSIGFVSIIGC
jgi:hypothetical protein